MAKVAQYVIDQLSDQGIWYNDVGFYLTLILKNQPIQVFDETNNITQTLDPEQGWEFVKSWALKNNFSISKRGSHRSQIESLLGDISNRQKLEAEAASSLNSLKAKAREGVPIEVAPSISSSLQKAEAIQYRQIKELESRLFAPMTKFYYNSPLLRDISDLDLRMRAATLLSAHPQLISYYNPTNNTSGRAHLSRATNEIQYILTKEIPELFPFYATLNSDQTEANTEKTLLDAKVAISKIYPGKNKENIDARALNSDLNDLVNISYVGSSLTDISDIINSLPPAYLKQDISGLDQIIRQIVVRAGSGTHVSGNELLTQLIKEGKLHPDAALKLQFLAPRLELAELKIRSELSGNDLLDRTNTREKWSANLAIALGLNPSTFWINDKEFEEIKSHFLGKYGGSSLEEAMAEELKSAKDLKKYKELSALYDQESQRAQYFAARKDNTMFYLQDQMNKLGYNLQVVKEPYTKASRRIWDNIDNLDEIIHYPQRKLADYWEDLVDGRKTFLGLRAVIDFKTRSGRIIRVPLLNLPSFFFGQFTELQKYLAEKVFKWSWGLSRQGGLFAPLKHIANYSFGFIQHEGDFRSTNFFFGHKAMGNFLNWGAQKLGHESFTLMKKAWGEVALKIGNKITGGLISKAMSYLAALGLSVEGVGVFLTAAMLAIDLFKAIGGFFKKFFNNENFRNKILNIVPTVGIFLAGLGTFIAGIPAAIALGFTGLISFLGAALSGIALFFIQGAIWTGAAVIGILLIFQFLKITSVLDSGTNLTQIITDIACEEDGAGAQGGGGNKVASCASCLVKYLQQCYGQSVTGTKIKSKGISCIIASSISQDSAAAIEASATYFNYLQCVGFARAAAVCAGNQLPGQAVASDYIRLHTPGYKFVRGAESCQAGDFGIIDGSIGHIFVFGKKNGSLVNGIDANRVCSGCVSANTPITMSSVAGCLKKL